MEQGDPPTGANFTSHSFECWLRVGPVHLAQAVPEDKTCQRRPTVTSEIVPVPNFAASLTWILLDLALLHCQRWESL